MLDQLLNSYMIDSKFQQVREFNHDPQQFNYEQYTQEALIEFKVMHEKAVKARPTIKNVGKPRDNPWFLK